MSPLNITQPLDSIRYMVYNGYYKVMSNIPKMGHLTTPVPSSKAQSDLIRKGAVHAAQAAQIQADEARALLLNRDLDALRRGEGRSKKGVAVEADGQDAVVHAVPWMGKERRWMGWWVALEMIIIIIWNTSICVVCVCEWYIYIYREREYNII